MDKYLFCIIHNELSICGRMADWGTRDPRRGLKLSCLVSSRMVLIRQVDLGRCMMRVSTVGLGLKVMVLTMPYFSRLKVGASSVGKNTVLLNLEWRKLKGLGELMRALNTCLDTKRV